MEMFARVDSVMIVLDLTAGASDVVGLIRRLVPRDIGWTVLAVTDKHPSITTGATGFAAPVLSPDEMEERAQGERVEADAAAAATARALGDRPVRQLVEQGDVVAAVERVAHEHRFDLIVATSVDLAEQLTRGDIPLVLTVPSSCDVDPDGPVLVAVDDSLLDEPVVDSLLSLLAPTTEMLALDVTPTVASGVSTSAFGTVGVSAPDDVVHTLDDEAEAAVRRWIDRLGARDVTPTGAVGDPASRILDVAREHDAAMIVVGSRHRDWLSRLLRPSVSGEVRRHSDRPVLVLR